MTEGTRKAGGEGESWYAVKEERTSAYTCGHKLVEVAWHNVMPRKREGTREGALPCLSRVALDCDDKSFPFPSPLCLASRPRLFSSSRPPFFHSSSHSSPIRALFLSFSRVRARTRTRRGDKRRRDRGRAFYRASRRS